MKKNFIQLLTAVLIMAMLFTGCANGKTEKNTAGDANQVKALAGDYYLDLSKLGMKLTVYLRIQDDGTFQFSNTLDFAINKSAGTIEAGEGKYIMVYSSVNGEEKKLTEGITSSFTVTQEGNLDFSSCERIYYGSASAVTISAEDPAVILIGMPVPEGYQEVSTESSFKPGTYVAKQGESSYVISFFEDHSFLLSSVTSKGEYSAEFGNYGVSTSQLALTPIGADRLSGEVVNEQEIIVPVRKNETERAPLTFTLTGDKQKVMQLSGKAGESDAVLTLYSDWTFTSEANGFQENGILTLDSSAGIFKMYPDHPETGVRGMYQVGTVPAGSFTVKDGKMEMQDFRIRTSESLSRTKCILTETTQD